MSNIHKRMEDMDFYVESYLGLDVECEYMATYKNGDRKFVIIGRDNGNKYAIFEDGRPDLELNKFPRWIDNKEIFNELKARNAEIMEIK